MPRSEVASSGQAGISLARKPTSMAVWFVRRFKRLTSDRALILMYHRIAAGLIDPWGLAVSPDNFRSQLDMLSQNWRLVSLDQLVEQLRQGRPGNRTVAITFDDGYADNCECALPELVKRNMPATLFVASGLIKEVVEPWWDQLSGWVMEVESLPRRLSLTIRGRRHEWDVPDLAAEDCFPAVNRLRPWLARQGTRLHVYYHVWQQLRPLSTDEREPLLIAIAQWAGCLPDHRLKYRMMTVDQLRYFAKTPGMQLGAHTVTHASLVDCDVTQRRQEIVQGCAWLRDHVGIEPVHFAYPFGEWDMATAGEVRRAGFQSASTTQQAPVWPGSNLWTLPRVALDDVDGATLDVRLNQIVRR